MAEENNSYEDDRDEGGRSQRDDRSRGRGPRGGGGSGGGGARRYGRRSRRCSFCADKVKKMDYKNVEMLRRYINNRGKIAPRRQTGTCAKHQRMLATTIKRARHVALLPFTAEHIHES